MRSASTNSEEKAASQNGTRALRLTVLAANDIVALDHRGYPHPGATIFHAALDADHFALGAHEDLGATGDLGRKGQGDVEFGARLKILIQDEVQTAGGDVAGLTFLGIGYAFGRDSNDHGQRQIIASSSATFRHYAHPPLCSRPLATHRAPFANFSSALA